MKAINLQTLKTKTGETKWVAYQNQVYDITSFVEKHPGGSYVIKNCAGRDVTELFQAYHHQKGADRIFGSSKVPVVGGYSDSPFPNYKKQSVFYETMKSRVRTFLKDKGVSNVRELTPFNIINTILIFVGLILSYLLSQYILIQHTIPAIFFACTAGLCHHLALVHLYHDMGHTSYGRNQWITFLLNKSSDFLVGMNEKLWFYRHTLGHHIHTNVYGIDPDLAAYRCAPGEPAIPYRLGQSVIPWNFQKFTYMFIFIQMQIDDMFSYARRSMENIHLVDQNTLDVAWFWTSKAIFVAHRLILPVVFGRSVLGALGIFMVTEFFGGAIFGYFSQISHLGDDCAWPTLDNVHKLDWAEYQIRTAHDYAHHSAFWTYLAGYLNFQAVHHLFPGYAPHLYPMIAPIVKHTCKEFKIPYHVHQSFLETVTCHFQHMKQFQQFRKKTPFGIPKSITFRGLVFVALPSMILLHLLVNMVRSSS